jgi:hypothetical protein
MSSRKSAFDSSHAPLTVQFAKKKFFFDTKFHKENQGKFGKLQMFYKDVYDLKFNFNDHLQISRLRWNERNQHWEGMHQDSRKLQKYEILSDQWVKENFPADFRNAVQTYGRNVNKKFLSFKKANNGIKDSYIKKVKAIF